MEKTGRQHLLEALKELAGRELKELRAKISQVWLKRGLEGSGLLRGALHPSLWLMVDAELEVTVEGLRAVNRGDLAEELAALLDAYEKQRREQRSATSRARGHLLCTLNELGENELGRFKVKLADMGQKGGYNPIPWGWLGRAKPAEVTAELINHYGVHCGLETAGERPRPIIRGPTADPWGGQERAQVMEMIEELVSTYGEGHTVWMTQEMLRAMSQGPLAERLAEAAGI
ncbi:unnamed protein product, partial [Natator depressus]